MTATRTATAAEIAERLNAKPTATGWMANCPAHEDKNASLSISEGKDGRALLHCFAGCTFDAIRAAAGIVPEHRATPPAKASKPTKAGRTWQSADAAAAACCPAGFRLVAVYPYDAGAVARFENDGGKTFRQFHQTPGGWAAGGPSGLWPLFGVDALPPSGPIFVCEGEKATLAAREIGLTATCSAGGAQGAARSDWQSLRGRNVCILPDADEPGAQYAADVARLAREAGASSVRFVRLPDLPPGGDVADFIEMRDAQDAETIRATIEGLAAAAPAEPDAPRLVIVQGASLVELIAPEHDPVIA